MNDNKGSPPEKASKLTGEASVNPTHHHLSHNIFKNFTKDDLVLFLKKLSFYPSNDAYYNRLRLLILEKIQKREKSVSIENNQQLTLQNSKANLSFRHLSKSEIPNSHVDHPSSSSGKLEVWFE